MKIRLHSPALIARFGETCDLPDTKARAYIAAGVATLLEKKAKKKTSSAKKESAENTSA